MQHRDFQKGMAEGLTGIDTAEGAAINGPCLQAEEEKLRAVTEMNME